MKITSIDEANKILAKYVPSGNSMRGAYTLDRMRKLMDALGNPQDMYKTVHVAGTSGKTSTAYYVAAFLKEAGLKTGLTVSPHIDSVTERVQINLAPLSEKEFCKELESFLDELEKIAIRPTYFELLVAFVYWEFARQEVEYVVVEVGLGGLLDGTNVIHRPDKICVITDIGMDHITVLGNTIPAIASQKAGIIQPHNKVFMYEQTADVMNVVREVSESQQADLHEIARPGQSDVPAKLPLFQQRNWYLANRVVEYILEREQIPQFDKVQLENTATTYIPARMEIVHKEGKTIIFDGAHNAHKMRVLAKSIRQQFPEAKIATMFSLIKSKDFRLRTTLEVILKLSDHVIITAFEAQQDMRR
jgi:dihydrofolate synthase/folylpolyglutamate synthase